MEGGGIGEAIFGGLKRVGEVGIDLGKAVGQIPFNVVTGIPEFLKDPEVFLSGGREGALAALFSSDYRKRQKADLTAAREMQKFAKINDTMKFVDGLFSNVPFDQRAEVARVAEMGGASSDLVEQGLASANKQDQIQRGVAASAEGMGLPSDIAQYVQPEQLPGLYQRKLAADNIQSRADAAAARTGRRLTLAERRERRLARRPPELTEEQKFGRELAEKGAKSVFDTTAEGTAQRAGALAATISDPSLSAGISTQVPVFSARRAKREAEKFIEEQTPLTSRKNIFKRKAAKKAVADKIKELPQDTGLDSGVLDEAPLPTDPAERLKEAERMGTMLLAAGFPPDKAAAELIRRGFAPEELPE